MNKALYSAIAILLAGFLQSAAAKDIVLSCTLRSGNRLPLTISDKKVLKDGQTIKNFDQRSLVVGPSYITFNQAFTTYDNAWSINRNNLKLTFKTILKSDSKVVLEDTGSCAYAAAAPRLTQKRFTPGTGLSATIAAWFQQ